MNKHVWWHSVLRSPIFMLYIHKPLSLNLRVASLTAQNRGPYPTIRQIKMQIFTLKRQFMCSPWQKTTCKNPLYICDGLKKDLTNFSIKEKFWKTCCRKGWALFIPTIRRMLACADKLSNSLIRILGYTISNWGDCIFPLSPNMSMSTNWNTKDKVVLCIPLTETKAIEGFGEEKSTNAAEKRFNKFSNSKCNCSLLCTRSIPLEYLWIFIKELFAVDHITMSLLDGPIT